MALDSSVPSFIFDANAPANAPGSYSALEMRRRIAAQLASQKKPFPKTFGEGLTYLGESIGEARMMSQLDAQERAYRQQQMRAGQSAPPIGVPPAVQNSVTPAAAASGVAPTIAPAPTPGLNKGAMSTVGDVIGRNEPDPTMRDYYVQLAAREDPSGGQRVSPTGAAGPFQFTHGTARQYGLIGADGADTRTDPEASLKAVQQLTRDNARQFMSINGRVPTLGELALMHQQGGVTGARMVAGTGNAPSRNLTVNNINPSLGPQDAAAKVQAYYKMPDARMPDDYLGGDTGGGREAVARALTAPGVPQENPTDAGPLAPPAAADLPAGEDSPARPVQVASLDPSIGAATRAPDPTMGMSAVAPREAADNPPIPTDIAPAPQPPSAQVAQAGGVPVGVPRGIPGPLDPPTPLPPDPSVGRTPVPGGFGAPPVKPPDPVPAPVTAHEQWGYRQLMMSDDPVIRALAEKQIAFGQAQRSQEDVRRMDKYKAERALYDQQQTAWDTFARETPKRELELRKGESELADKQRQDELRQRLGGVDPKFYETQIAESQKNVAGLPGAAQAIGNARRALIDQNAFTGSDAEIRLSMAKLMDAAGFKADPRIPATEQFRSFMAPVVAQMRQALVGGAQISNADIQMAEKAGGGNITLDRKSITGIMDAIERINLATAVAHQNKLLTYAGNDPDRQRNIFGVVGVPTATMQSLVPERFKERLRQGVKTDPSIAEEFDRKFATPGLARRVLEE